MSTGDTSDRPWLLADGGVLPAACRVAIVGGGLCGLEVAKELAAHGVPDVLVLEAGHVGDLRHVNMAHSPEQALRLWLQPHTDDSFHQPWRSQNPPHYTGSAGLRRRVGGRSLYWHGVCLPLEPWALVQPWWPADIVNDLRIGWRGGPSLYQRLDEQLRRWHLADPCGPPLADETFDGSLAGIALRTTPSMIRRSTTDPARWYAYSPLDAWRDPDTGVPYGQAPGFHIVPGAEVLNVEVRSGRCRGVVVRNRATGASTLVAADAVVLAAGTLETTRLAAQALYGVGAIGRPRLGGLWDHLVQGFLLRLTPAQARPLWQEFRPGSYYAACGERSYLFFEITELAGGAALVDVRLSGEQLPSPDSYVECVPAESFPWAYEVHADVGAADWEVVASQRQILQAIADDLAKRTGCEQRMLAFGDFGRPERTNACVLPEHVRAMADGIPVTWSSYLGFEDHEGGTVPLGVRLNNRHEFADLPGLYAAGPATFPRAGAANPALTALALAHRLVAELADAMRTPAI